MDRYQRVEKPKPEEVISENEIRITAQGLIRNYITYAITLLQEKHTKEIVLKAMGQAISKTVAIAEFIKRRVPGLYQDTSVSSTSIIDVWEPIEEGLTPLEINRQVSLITITLSTVELNKNSPGFQAPSLMEPSKPQRQIPQQQLMKQRPAPMNGFNEAPYDQGRNYGRGRGRGRGRVGYRNYHQDSYGQGQQYGRGRGRSWGRGGYGNYQESSGYHYYGGGGPGRGSVYLGYERGRGGGRGYSYKRGQVANRGRGRGSRRLPLETDYSNL